MFISFWSALGKLLIITSFLYTIVLGFSVKKCDTITVTISSMSQINFNASSMSPLLITR